MLNFLDLASDYQFDPQVSTWLHARYVATIESMTRAVAESLRQRVEHKPHADEATNRALWKLKREAEIAFTRAQVRRQQLGGSSVFDPEFARSAPESA